MSDGESLLLAVDAGEAPVGVYADWCEEQGLEWVEGVRLLAEAERWPAHDEDGWYWRVNLQGRIEQPPHPAILPVAVWKHVHPKLYEAGRRAVLEGLLMGSAGPDRFRTPASYPRFASLESAVERAARAYMAAASE